jgi:crotonobetainyl-CoA:carnitine CoA-transferase CaiB-like acyl-CoA transferase
MAGKLCALYGAEVVRPEGPMIDPAQPLGRFLDAGKQQSTATGFNAAIGPVFDAAIGSIFDAAIGDANVAGAPILLRFSVFGPGQDPAMSELGLLALSGLLGIVGESHRPPAALAGHQPAYAAGLAGCTALLAALHAGGPETGDISLFDVTCWLNWKVAAAMMVNGLQRRYGPTNILAQGHRGPPAYTSRLGILKTRSPEIHRPTHQK